MKDSADNCPLIYNPDQSASIGTATILGDACDDEDADSIIDAMDNCPVQNNSDQADADGNGVGDACDACEVVAMVANIWSGWRWGSPWGFYRVGWHIVLCGEQRCTRLRIVVVNCGSITRPVRSNRQVRNSTSQL